MKFIPHTLAMGPDFQAKALFTGALVVLPVVVAVAFAVHLVIERPFFSFKRVYILPTKPMPETRSLPPPAPGRRGLATPSLAGGARRLRPPIPIIGLANSAFEVDPVTPTERTQLGNVEEFARGPVGL